MDGLLDILGGAFTAGFSSGSRRVRALWFWFWIGVLLGAVGFLACFGHALAWVAAVAGPVLGLLLGVVRYFTIREPR